MSNYDDEADTCGNPDYARDGEDDALMDMPTVSRVGIVQSPTLNAYYEPCVALLTHNTGATSTMIQVAFARRVGMHIEPATQVAHQADGKAPLKVLGEVNCVVTRGQYTYI